MRFDIITIFPEIFSEVFDFGIIRRAVEASLIEIQIHDLRGYTHDKHRQVDDRPFGGGAGMVMKPEPVFRAVESLAEPSAEAKVVLLSPQGRLFSQQVAEEFSRQRRIVLICGRYEGVDERVTDLITDEVSIGDYVLSGGEMPAMVIVDAVTRLIPGALGSDESAGSESFVGGLLDYPQYTRPAEYRGMKVPEVLLSGNHAEIERWRRRKAIEKTLRSRPDLIRGRVASDSERHEIEEILKDISDEERD